MWFLLPMALGLMVGFFLWPRETRDFLTSLVTGIVIGAMAGIIALLMSLIPRPHVTYEIHRIRNVRPPQVVYRDRIIYRAPNGEVKPVDVSGVCKGKAPIQLTEVSVSGKDDDQVTYVTGHVVGSKVSLTCSEPGNYSDTWKVDDVIQIVRGTPQ